MELDIIPIINYLYIILLSQNGFIFANLKCLSNLWMNL